MLINTNDIQQRVKSLKTHRNLNEKTKARLDDCLRALNSINNSELNQKTKISYTNQRNFLIGLQKEALIEYDMVLADGLMKIIKTFKQYY